MTSTTSPRGTTRRECPECGVKMTRYQWSKMWWMSSFMSGRLVEPCADCGARLRLSSMVLIASISAVGLLGVAVGYALHPSTTLLMVALALLLVILFAMMATRVESVPASSERR